MDRREFLKNAALLAALSPISRIAAAVPEKAAGGDGGGKVTRRPCGKSGVMIPLLGFGMMRLPKISPDKPEIDYAEVRRQLDIAMAAGVNYFDTAYFYHGGRSEKCAGDLLTSYPRSSYFLADKMPVRLLRKEADIERIWNEQLQRCRTEYFDFYLLHNLNRKEWEKAEKLKLYEFLLKRKAEGRIRFLGFSFHDEPEVLKTIAVAHPWDFAQIQLNYLDWTLYRSEEQYGILTSRGIPVIVMEPLRGGALAALNPKAVEIFKKADPSASPASWAFRYAASLPNVLCVLSGMTKTEHLRENIRTFTNFRPLNDDERKTVAAALAAYRTSGVIPCTGCRYCVPCPAGVEIPRIFGLYNQYRISGNKFQFRNIYGRMDPDSRADACVECGACLKKCPQHINIPAEMLKIAAEAKKLN